MEDAKPRIMGSRHRNRFAGLRVIRVVQLMLAITIPEALSLVPETRTAGP